MPLAVGAPLKKRLVEDWPLAEGEASAAKEIPRTAAPSFDFDVDDRLFKIEGKTEQWHGVFIGQGKVKIR